MLTKTIKYTDYNGVEREEDFYFHLSKNELLESELETEGGFVAMVEEIVKKQDIPKMSKIFRKLILDSYGEKSPDGRRFIKSKELSEAFYQSPAYEKLFMSMISDMEVASDFVNNIVPSSLTQQDEGSEPRSASELPAANLLG